MRQPHGFFGATEAADGSGRVPYYSGVKGPRDCDAVGRPGDMNPVVLGNGEPCATRILRSIRQVPLLARQSRAPASVPGRTSIDASRAAVIASLPDRTLPLYSYGVINAGVVLFHVAYPPLRLSIGAYADKARLGQCWWFHIPLRFLAPLPGWLVRHAIPSVVCGR